MLISAFRSLALCFSMLAVLAAPIQSDLAAASSPQPWPLTPNGTSEEGESWGTLSNGLRYVVIPTDAPSNGLSLRLLVAAGREQEAAEAAGSSELLARILSDHGKEVGGDELLRFRLAHGINPSSRTRFTVDMDYTVYRVDLDEPEAGALDLSLSYLSEIAGTKALDASVFEEERKRLLHEAGQGGSRFYPAQAAVEETIFRESLYKKFGDAEVAAGVGGMGIDTLETYLKQWYVPERMTVVVTGVVEASEVAPQIEAAFASLAQGGEQGLAQRSRGKLRGTGEIELLKSATGSSRYSFSSVLEGQDLFQADQERRYYQLDMLGRFAIADALGSKELGRSAVEVSGDNLAVSLSYRGAVRVLLEQVMTADKTIARLNEYGLLEDELTELKEKYLALRHGYDVMLNTQPWAAPLADRVVRCIVDRVPLRYGAEFSEFLEESADSLTQAQAKNLCETHFQPKKMIYYIELPGGIGISQKSIVKRLKATRKAYDFTWEQARGFDQDWNIGSGFERNGMVASTEIMRFEEYPVLQYEFENNLRLNFVRTDEFPGQIHVKVAIGNGLSEMQNQSKAVESLLRKLLLKAKIGAGAQAPSIKDVLETKGVTSLDAGVNLENLYWSAIASDADGVSEFLSAIMIWMVTSDLDEEAFDDEIEKMKDLSKSGFTTSVSAIQDKLLYRGDDRLKAFFDEESVDGIDYTGLREWLARSRQESYLEITVVGDVLPRTLLRDVRNTFGSAPDRSGKVMQPRHGKSVEWRDSGIERGEYRLGGAGAMIALVYPQVEEKSCRADLRSTILRPLLEAHIRSELKSYPEFTDRLSVSVTAQKMVPLSSALHVQVNCAVDQAEEAEAKLVEAMSTFAESLDPVLVAAAERNAWIGLKRVPRSPVHLLAMFNQSQGRPNSLRCSVEVLEGGVSSPFDSYVEAAQAQFSEDNLRGAVIVPEGL